MRSLAISLGLVAAMSGTALLCTQPRLSRSVGPAQLASLTPEPPGFSRDESTALFVGVRTFRHDDTLTVPFAGDDAIDLAYRFTLDQRVGLIPPRRAVLALSGSPQKEESKRRLAELKAAGVRVENATSGDIDNLLREQVSQTGRRGLFVLSLATHGFQHNGDSYILGSTSSFDSPGTSLRTAKLLEIAGETPRSLIFIDACRDRIGPGSRGASPDPAAAAPHIRRMGGVQGQVIFYAAAPGEYAYDDEVHQNGVFTKAVLDGLACEASAPNGTVVAQTLHTYVDREVRGWIQKNHNKTVDPATQISMEGTTRNMPLSECWRDPGPLIRVSVDDSLIAAYSESGKTLFRHDLRQPIVAAEAADLDADARYEVVVGLRDRIEVLDRDGKLRWKHPGHGGTLETFTTGDLFEKKTAYVVAVWYDGHSSHLVVLDRNGKEHSTFEYPGKLTHVAVGRPTNMHAPKIVATTRDGVLLLHPRKLENAPPLWHRRASGDTIRDLRILDIDHDSRRDIVVTTDGGTSWLTFDGKIVRGKAAWTDVAVRRRGKLRE
ncbi:MAG TPA: caspase family protein [Thermoanaerobaculia bacterium]|nr:caspase family protein [Thermoanaerobaculia bacterium]